MVQSSSREVISTPGQKKKSEDLLLRSRVFAIGLRPEPDESNPKSRKIFF
jgi:hypothetical protein